LFKLRGNDYITSCIDFSKDGKLLASAGEYDNAIILWALHTGRAPTIQRKLERQGGAKVVQFSSDSKKLVSASLSEVTVWSVESGMRLLGYSSQGLILLSRAVWSPDSSLVACTGLVGNVHVWKAQDGTLAMAPLEGHKIQCLAFGLEGRFLITGHVDGDVVIWRLAEGEDAAECARLKGHVGCVHSLVVSPDFMRLASAGCDKTVRLWEISTGQNITVFEGHGDDVRCLAWSSDGKFLVSGSYGKVCVWNAHVQVGWHVCMCVCV
jgi:WD40 repeat protein